MDPVNLGKNPPFVPVTFKTAIAPLPPKTYSSMEGLYAKLYPYSYAGQNQTGQINTKFPKPVIMVVDLPGLHWTVNPGPPWETGPLAADPALSASFGSYMGSGRGTMPTGLVGTINAGTPVTVTQPGSTVQVRLFKGSDGNLYILDNDNNTYMVAAGGTLKPVPPVYAPSR
jgi:hypothetical protein